MKHSFINHMQKNPRLLSDGAWGTELFKRGVPPGDAPERLNLKSPKTVMAVAADYVAAGSDIILTNSFGGTRFQLEHHDLGANAAEINRLAAELSKDAATAGDGIVARTVLVAGSMGPSGKMLLMGDISRDELYDGFLEQAHALVAGGVDLLLVESMTDIEEALTAIEAAAEAAKEAQTVGDGGNIPIIASMVYEPVKTGGYRTIMGNTPEDCVSRSLEAGANVVGANCGTGIENYLDLAEELCRLDLAPVWIKPNRGIPEVVDRKTVYRQTATEFSEYSAKLLGMGVAVIGGCCGTSPEFVRTMRGVVDDFNRSDSAAP